MLPDGRQIDPDDVLGEEKPVTCLVVVGDVGRPEKLLDFVRGADTLVIESTYLKEEVQLATEFGHSTAESVAHLANEAGVGKLILTHVSRRYKDESVNAEAQAIFPNAILARDFDVFQVKRKS
jgi:ribonuclease Z